MTQTNTPRADLALVQSVVGEERQVDDRDINTLRAYLSDEISLGRAAELLDLSRFELQARFHRLGVPLRLGPAPLEQARAEVAAARKFD